MHGSMCPLSQEKGGVKKPNLGIQGPSHQQRDRDERGIIIYSRLEMQKIIPKVKAPVMPNTPALLLANKRLVDKKMAVGGIQPTAARQNAARHLEDKAGPASNDKK